MLPLMLLAPVAAAIAAVAVNRKYRFSKYLALAGSLASLALFPLISSGTESINWFSIGNAAFDITTTVAPINVILLLTVLLISPVVLVYSFGAVVLPSEQKRFYLEMLALEGAMLAFAMSGGFVLLFAAWEVLSLATYLLIGFHGSDSKANGAARKAMTMVVLGDLALLGAMAIVLSSYGTLDFKGIAGATPLTAVILLLVAILTKSAQFPFHEWLPDAMDGPTPFSAVLGSGTVKAGIFAAIVLFPVFSASGTLPVLFYIGLITTVIGTVNASRERRIKRVIAYSVVQGLGLMLLAVGSGAILAAVYFMFVQSFYTALLVFSAGTSVKANGKDSLDEMGGLTQNRIIYVSTLFGIISLAGFVPFSGFFAYLGVGYSFGTDFATYAFISIVGMATGFYSFRWFTLQTKNTGRTSTALDYKTVPKSTTLGLVLLSAATLLAGSAAFVLPGYLGYGGLDAAQFTGYGAVAETAAVAIGAGVGYLIYRQRKKATARRLAGNPAEAAAATRVMNSAYGYFAAFVLLVGEGVSQFDAEANGMFDRFGHAIMKSANALKRLAPGEINAYVIMFAVGMLLLLFALAVV